MTIPKKSNTAAKTRKALRKPRKTRKSVQKHPEIAARLQELMGGRSIRTFAEDIGIKERRVSVWVRGEAAPNAASLKAMCLSQGVTPGWILDMDGEPRHRKQIREPVALERDVAEHVARELRKRVPALKVRRAAAVRWRVDGAAALEAAVEALRAPAEAELQRVEQLWELLSRSPDEIIKLSSLARRLRKQHAGGATAQSAADALENRAVLRALAVLSDLEEATRARRKARVGPVQIVRVIPTTKERR